MIVIIVHRFAHRLADNGLVESAPVNGLSISKDFIPRTAESMDLSGGDFEAIRQDLKHLQLFGQRTEPLPHSSRATSLPTAGGVKI